jgi:DNA-binding IclR family transcriptional regulator
VRDGNNDKPVAAVERALDILNAFQRGDDALSLAALSDRTGLYKSTLLRLTATLEDYGYLTRALDGRYRVGYKPLAVGSLFQRSTQSPDTTMPILESLVAKTGESAAFNVREGAFRVCLYRVESPHVVRAYLRAGDVKPIDRGAAGRIILAFTKPFDASGAGERSTMAATSFAEITPEVTSVAVPVFGPGDTVAGSLSFSGPAGRFGPDVLATMRTLLLTEAARLTGILGGDAEPFERVLAATPATKTSRKR